MALFKGPGDQMRDTILNPSPKTPTTQPSDGSKNQNLDPYYNAMMNRQNPNSTINELYNMFQTRGSINFANQMDQQRVAQRDTEVMNAQDRSQMMDSIRNNRRSKLKRGASSAQIASEEIQAMLSAQELANANNLAIQNNIAGLRTDYATNEQDALLQAYNMFSTQNLGPLMGTQYASMTADPLMLAERMKTAPKEVQDWYALNLGPNAGDSKKIAKNK